MAWGAWKGKGSKDGIVLHCCFKLPVGTGRAAGCIGGSRPAAGGPKCGGGLGVSISVRGRATEKYETRANCWAPPLIWFGFGLQGHACRPKSQSSSRRNGRKKDRTKRRARHPMVGWRESYQTTQDLIHALSHEGVRWDQSMIGSSSAGQQVPSQPGGSSQMSANLGASSTLAALKLEGRASVIQAQVP